MERDHCRARVRYALGITRIEALSDRQYRLLENSLEELFATKSHWEITNEEIFGKYELVTEYMSPLSQEIAIQNYEKRKKLN